jgi:hypothetical protein
VNKPSLAQSVKSLSNRQQSIDSTDHKHGRTAGGMPADVSVASVGMFSRQRLRPLSHCSPIDTMT